MMHACNKNAPVRLRNEATIIENMKNVYICIYYIFNNSERIRFQCPIWQIKPRRAGCPFFTKRARVSCLVDAMSPKNWWPTSVWRPFCWRRASWWRLNMLECNQLVVGLEHDFYDFPFSCECHHPNWRTHIFQRAWNHQPDPSKSKYNDLFQASLIGKHFLQRCHGLNQTPMAHALSV